MSMSGKEPVRVAVGIVVKNGKILCCQRRKHSRYGLQWEFPGGKILHGEDPEDCLKRELYEELNISAESIEPYNTHIQSYSDNGLFEVHYFIIKNYTGTLKNKVFESTRWIAPDKLDSFPFLEGNIPVITKLKEEYTRT